MASGRKQLADAISRQAKDHARRSRVTNQIGVVKRLKPLLVDPADLDYNLDDDDIVLSQWVRAYKENTGLKVGDNLVLHRAGGHWVAVDVIADKKRPLKVKRRKKKKSKGSSGGGGESETDSAEPEYESDEEQSEDEAAEAQEEKLLEEGATKSEAKGFMHHKDNADAERPDYSSVEWNGTVFPKNAKNTDTLVVPGGLA